MKALYVGQIERAKQQQFRNLMDSLSGAYEKYTGEDKRDGTTCILYDYYNTNRDVTQTEINKNIFQGIKPAKWAEAWATNQEDRTNCIEIINYVLGLSEFKEYLDAKKSELTRTHDIGCCVTYYHNRQGGEIGFHQDSLGAELFVSLIYRDPVYGPELKLKDQVQFEKRIAAIREFMPECFITELEELYKNVKDKDNGLVEIKGELSALSADLIEWPGDLPNPGGVVGWVDELMIHTTPYMLRRKANGGKLLSILEEMKGTYNYEDEEVKSIKLLKDIIEGIILQERDHYITFNELERMIQNKGEDAKINLKELYSRLIVSEQELLDSRNEEDVEPWLYFSNHDLYNGANSREHTGSKERRLSMRIKNGSIPDIEQAERRSFIRVWVVAFPK